MILVAPDKFKGTLTAKEAATIIADELRGCSCLLAPMADGGEGTAQTIASALGWQPRPLPGRLPGEYYVDEKSRTAAIDSSAVIGIEPGCDILKRSSAPLGVIVREIVKSGCEKVLIGVGGTGVCDGGAGFLEGLGIEQYRQYADKLVGLCDVRVPLLPERPGGPSALMFAPQKGATALDMPVLARRLEQVRKDYARAESTPYDGAGGGLGFALANAIGAECHDGAEYVLGLYGIDWSAISLAITGEGRIDSQTDQGKAACAVVKAAMAHGKPAIAIGGDVDACALGHALLVSTSDFLPGLELNRRTAELRLRAAAASLRGRIKELTTL